MNVKIEEETHDTLGLEQVQFEENKFVKRDDAKEFVKTEKDTFHCKFCDETFDSQETLGIHMKQHILRCT